MSQSNSLLSLILTAIAVAMGVAVVVLSLLKTVTPETGVLLLGLGLFCLAVATLQNRRA